MDMFERRMVDIGYQQKVRYRGIGTRVYRGKDKVQVLVEQIRGDSGLVGRPSRGGDLS